MTVSQLRHALNQVPAIWDDLEVSFEEEGIMRVFEEVVLVRADWPTDKIFTVALGAPAGNDAIEVFYTTHTGELP
jgi:hypothetical protein